MKVDIELRPSTDPLQFKGDWPGVFIRGDDALLSFGPAITKAMDYCGDDVETKERLRRFANLLKSCKATPEIEQEVIAAKKLDSSDRTA